MESLGNKLRSAREEKGLTFDYISHDTNISARFLEALEKEDFSGFPGEPYVLGFIKNYGEYLGLNSEELLPLYRSLRIQEQPVPVEQLLKKPSPLPKILITAAAALLVAGLAAGGIYLFSRSPQAAEEVPAAAREPEEYTMSSDVMEERLYPGDSVLIPDEPVSHRILLSSLDDVVTLAAPGGGNITLELGEEVSITLRGSFEAEFKIIAEDFDRNNSAAGARLRFEYTPLPQQEAALPALPLPVEAAASGTGGVTVISSSPNPYTFTLQAVFQGYCFFRHEILAERDKQGKNERYYQRTEEIGIAAQNGIRFGISNAQAVKLQVIAGGRTVPLETGGPGEVVAAELRWVIDADRRYSLVLRHLE